MKKLTTATQWYGPFNEITATDVSYICDDCVFMIDVVGVGVISEYNPETDVHPPTQEEIDQIMQANKDQATQLLTATDWTAIASVGDPLLSNPYLVNQAEFLSYRSAVRAIAVNPPQTYAVFPDVPTEQWSS